MTTSTENTSTPEHVREIGEAFVDKPLDPFRYDGHTPARGEVVARLCQLIPTGSRVLDVGCGTGSVSRYIASHVAKGGGNHLGIEPNAERAQLARDRGLNVTTGYLDEESLKSLGKFDVIMFADVLEHLPDPAAMIRIAKLGLTPNGAIVASVPNVAHWTVRLNLLIGRFNYAPTGIMDSTHLRWFTRRTLRNCFASEGFRTEQILPAAGVTLPVYNHFPARFIPGKLRRPIIRTASRTFPGLWASQFVIRAVPDAKH